jgi:hypothetical protein
MDKVRKRSNSEYNKYMLVLHINPPLKIYIFIYTFQVMSHKILSIYCVMKDLIQTRITSDAPHFKHVYSEHLKT